MHRSPAWSIRVRPTRLIGALMSFALCVALLTHGATAPATAVNGSTPSSPLGPNDTVTSVVAAPGGGFYVGGYFTHWGVQTGGLGSFMADDGEVNPYFPWVNGIVEAIESDGNGGWFIGGSFDLVGGCERQNLAHINADGDVTAFAPTTDDSVLAIDPSEHQDLPHAEMSHTC